MSKWIWIAGLFCFLVACNSADTGAEPSGRDSLDKDRVPVADSSSGPGYYKVDGDSLVIPSFTIDISLSEKAKQKLAGNKETIIVAAYFSGQPIDTMSEEYLKAGEISIASATREIKDGEIARFENIKFPRQLYDSLADKDIQLLINVYSGRRSGTDNLLNCDILQDKMSNIQGRNFTLKGKLIYGED